MCLILIYAILGREEQGLDDRLFPYQGVASLQGRGGERTFWLDRLCVCGDESGYFSFPTFSLQLALVVGALSMLRIRCPRRRKGKGNQSGGD